MRWSPLLGLLLVVVVLAGCASTREIRIENLTEVDFSDVMIADQSYGDVAAGELTEYRPVRLRFRYGLLRLTADGRDVNAQTLNFGARRFTYRVDIIDLEAGHLDVEVVRD